MVTRSVGTLAALVVAASVLACDQSPTPPLASTPDIDLPLAKDGGPSRPDGPSLNLLGHSIDAVNEALSRRGAPYRLARAEWVSAARVPRGPALATENHVVFANNRNLRLDSRWIPDGPGREDRDDLLYMVTTPYATANIWSPFAPGSTPVDGEGAIDASFATWSGVTCSDIAATKLPWDGRLPSFLLGGDISDLDVGIVGFLPGVYFDAFLADPDDPTDMPSDYVLGVTFTIVWGSTVDGEFVPSDIDGNGLLDTAFKEVWYNDDFDWSVGPGAIDIETVALHENGHVFELGHFGKIHATYNQGTGNDRLGWLHVSPRAVMNAAILGIQREPLGTDNAAFCGNFGTWPIQ